MTSRKLVPPPKHHTRAKFGDSKGWQGGKIQEGEKLKAFFPRSYNTKKNSATPDWVGAVRFRVLSQGEIKKRHRGTSSPQLKAPRPERD